MTFTLNEGEKFACIAFHNVALDTALPPSVHLGKNQWVVKASPFTVDPTWRKWLGSVKSEELDRCDLFLIATRGSTNPEVLDGENKELQEIVLRLFYGLLLQGIPEEPRAFRLTGARINDSVSIRQYELIDTHYRSRGTDKFPIASANCVHAKVVADGLASIYANTDFERLKRGLRALMRGMKERYPEDRVHEYVRALEALIKPEIGQTRRQFLHRCQTFTGASKDNERILGECYEIRNTVEHMHPWVNALTGHLARDRESMAFLRLRQIELLALEVYQRITTSVQHAAIFRTDTEIDAFWKMGDDERTGQWGIGLDLQAVP